MQVKWKGGYEKLAFSTNISVYFKNDKKYGHTHNGRQIGTRINQKRIRVTKVTNVTARPHRMR